MTLSRAPIHGCLELVVCRSLTRSFFFIHIDTYVSPNLTDTKSLIVEKSITLRWEQDSATMLQ